MVSGSHVKWTPKNQQDKSLEVYKFYINALYVAITRAVNSLYIIESNQKHL